MTISIPIISEFDGKGIAKAKQEFSQLEGAGAKANYAIKKAALPAAAALAGVGAALFDATKAAMEDETAQKQLALALKNSTGASDAAVAATEDWISAQGRALGVTDDELRPALAKLSRQTHSVAEAQKAAKLAMDISAATGKDLSTVSDTLAKAYGGNTAALAKLSPELKSAIKDGMSLDDAMAALESTFGGAAEAAANTAEGGFKRLQLGLAETKESIGAALIPVVEKLIPVLLKISDWAQKNPQTFTIIAAAIAGIATSIMAINFAMSLNPFTAIALGIGVLVAGIAVAYNKFEGFRNLVRTVVNGLSDYFEMIANAWIKTTNIIIRGINLIKPGKDIPQLSTVNFGHIGGEPQQAASAGNFRMFEQAQTTTNTGGVLAKSLGGAQVNINVNGGDPNAVVDALRNYMRQNGAVPIRTTGYA
jgi:hypothetical protein